MFSTIKKPRLIQLSRTQQKSVFFSLNKGLEVSKHTNGNKHTKEGSTSLVTIQMKHKESILHIDNYY